MLKMFVLLLILCILGNSLCVYFDSYRGVILTPGELKKYAEAGNVQHCTTNVELPCDPGGWRRLDGTCNNLKFPSYGAPHTPTFRVLQPIYGEGLTDRKSERGGELPLVRKLRTKLLGERKVPDSIFTQLMTFFIVFSATDNGSLQDTLNYIFYTTHCCESRGLGEYQCTPQKIPDDDPVHRFSNVRCMNQTRPITFQTFGCLENGTTIPARLDKEPFSFDLSTIYNSEGNPVDRTFSGGELVLEEINGKLWPPGDKSSDNICVLNNGPDEDLCFKGTANGAVGGQFMAVLMFRQHNYIARQLAAVNPCWDDETLFHAARDINIAIHMQIYMYEFMAELLGRNNLIRDGIITFTSGFREMYDENILPQISEEFLYGLRYFHTVQETTIKMYDKNGSYSRTFPMTNLTLRTGFFLPDNNFEHITQSSFRQACAKFDHGVDPDMSEVGLGPLQYSTDITMMDLARGRQFGFQGYVKYREHCSGKTYRTFEDLEDVMDPDRIDILKDAYATLGDVDLMAGIWSERKVPGGHLPSTLYCIFVEQLRRSIRTDRFWYERRDRPHAFTRVQLYEIRKASMAGTLCVAEGSVTQIQKRPFLRIGPKNPLVSCKDIPIIDFNRWKDRKCENGKRTKMEL